jgi:hypothetical protein
VRSGPEVFPFCSGLKVWPGVAHSHASSLSPVTGFARLIAGFRVSRFAPVWAAVCAQVRRGIFTALARFCEFRCRVSHRPEFHLALDACHWSFFPRVKYLFLFYFLVSSVESVIASLCRPGSSSLSLQDSVSRPRVCLLRISSA